MKLLVMNFAQKQSRTDELDQSDQNAALFMDSQKFIKKATQKGRLYRRSAPTLTR